MKWGAAEGRSPIWPWLVVCATTPLLAWIFVDGALASVSAPTTPGATATTSPQISGGPAPGERLYLRDCAVCHGATGAGTPRGPALERVGTASVHFQLTTGRMPISAPGSGLFRPKPRYSSSEIDAIVEYSRDFVSEGPEIPTIELDGDVGRGGELYRTHCAGCHGTAGVGGALVYSDTSAPGLGGSPPVETAEAMLVGPGTMPTFTPRPLDEQELEDIVLYVEDVLRSPRDRGGYGLWHLGPVPEGAVGWIVGLGSILLIARWIGTTRGREGTPGGRRAPEGHRAPEEPNDQAGNAG